MRSGVDERRQVDVEDGDVDGDGHGDQGQQAGGRVAQHLALRQRPVTQSRLPKVVANQRAAQSVRVHAHVLDAAKKKGTHFFLQLHHKTTSFVLTNQDQDRIRTRASTTKLDKMQHLFLFFFYQDTKKLYEEIKLLCNKNYA